MAMFMDLGMVLLLVVCSKVGDLEIDRPQPDCRHPGESWDRFDLAFYAGRHRSKIKMDPSFRWDDDTVGKA
jgi:hypothetical protein